MSHLQVPKGISILVDFGGDFDGASDDQSQGFDGKDAMNEARAPKLDEDRAKRHHPHDAAIAN